MSMVITAERISKRYRISAAQQADARSLRAAITGRVQHLLHVASPFHTPHLVARDHWALQDISFQIRAGENVAILGMNGSGKTTLFRILSQITMPSSGRVSIHSRPACLLQSGTGFHPELSGRENIFLNGAVLGMARQEIARKFDEIVDFSGVEEFIDVPIKHYSSGMQARLGFSVAAHLDSQIMLLDEGMANGDSEFRAKCIRKLKEMSSDGRTLLFASHEYGLVKEICTRALVLSQGRLVQDTTDIASLEL